MQEKQFLMASEDLELTNVAVDWSFGSAQADGTMPPGSFRNVLRPSAEIVLLGKVEIFLQAKKEENVPANEYERWEGTGKEPEDVRGNEEAFRKVAFVREYIFAHYGQRLTVEELAARVLVTPEDLNRMFLAQEGMSVSAFLEDTRLERAAALLRGTDRKISSIAEGVGFSYVSYFCRRFRMIYGMTPRQYRLKGNRECRENAAAMEK